MKLTFTGNFSILVKNIIALSNEISMDFGTESRRIDQIPTTVQFIKSQVHVPILHSHRRWYSDSGRRGSLVKANELIRALGEDVSLNVHVIAVSDCQVNLTIAPVSSTYGSKIKMKKILVKENTMTLKY